MLISPFAATRRILTVLTAAAALGLLCYVTRKTNTQAPLRWAPGDLNVHEKNEVDFDACKCSGMHNKYNEGDKCADYSGYKSAWANGRWCIASTVNCPDARAHRIPATGNVPASGYGLSRAACTVTGKTNTRAPLALRWDPGDLNVHEKDEVDVGSNNVISRPIVVARCQDICAKGEADSADSADCMQLNDDLMDYNPMDERHRTKLPLLLLKAAFPNRQIKFMTLFSSQHCKPPAGVTVDVILVMWADRDAYVEGMAYTNEVRKYREAHSDHAVENVDGLLMYREAILVPHRRGRPFMIATHGEHWNEEGQASNLMYDVLLESKVERHRVHQTTVSLYFPEAARDFYNDHRMIHSLERLLLPLPAAFPPLLKTAERNSFCAFMYGQCNNNQDFNGYDPEIVVRTALFDVLNRTYKRVDGLGRCRRTPSKLKFYNSSSEEHEGGNFWSSSVDTYMNYKFVIAFEASFLDGYWSEKIVNAVLAHSVPIYGGKKLKPGEKPWLARYLNPERFIYCGFDTSVFGAGLNDPQATTQQAEQEPAPEEVASKRQAELNALKRKDLKAQARAAGVTQAEIDDAGDTDPAFPSKETLITLIQQREATAAAAAAAAAAVQRQERGVTETIRTLKEDLEACVAKVRRMDRDDALYLKTIRTPLLYNNSLNGTIFDIAVYGRALRKAFRMHQSYLLE